VIKKQIKKPTPPKQLVKVSATPTKKLTKKEIFLDGPKKIGLILLEQGIIIAKLNGMDYHKIEAEMKAKDYKHLVKIFNKYFKDIIKFELD
jgi:hypothetical protein